MEEQVRASRNWRGEVGAAIGTKLYVDMAEDFDGGEGTDSRFAEKCEQLIVQIKALPEIRPYLL
jgi:hypothetical protein